MGVLYVYQMMPYIGGSNFHRATNLSEGQVRGFKGDIIPLITKYFNCECKSYADFPFHHFLYNKKIPLLEGWINQTRRLEKAMLIFFS